MENNPEKETSPRLSEGERYSSEKRAFPHIINYQGVAYDLRSVRDSNGNGLYRMTSETRDMREEPSYLEVDKEGYVVEEWN